jgi:hypothetical protein
MATRPSMSSRTEAITDFLTGVALTFAGAWWLMIGVGIIHHQWLPGLPTLAWWNALLIFVVFDIMMACVVYGARVKLIR